MHFDRGCGRFFDIIAKNNILQFSNLQGGFIKTFVHKLRDAQEVSPTFVYRKECDCLEAKSDKISRNSER